MQTETVTILHTAGSANAHKIYTQNEVLPYTAGYHFTFEQRQIADLRAFYELLCEIETDRTAFLIRGVPLPWIAADKIVRRKSQGSDAAFGQRATHLFCVDVDNVIAPSGMTTTSTEAINYAVSKLPAEFHNASVVAQFSNSAGLSLDPPLIKLHLWFWGERPYADVELRRWAAKTSIADPAIYSAVQPHFTAQPLFVDMPDPFAGMSRIQYLAKATNYVSAVLPGLGEYGSQPRDMRSFEEERLEYGLGGKVIDGRETLLMQIRWSVLNRGHCKTEKAFFDRVWAIFQSQAVLTATSRSDNSYDGEKVMALCQRDWANHGTVVPAQPLPTLDAEAAAQVLQDEIWMALNCVGSTAVRATAGLGKTTATVTALMELADIRAMNVDIYAASRKEQRQWQELLTSAASEAGIPLRILIIEGRTKQNCTQDEAALLLGAAGIPANEYLCKLGTAKCASYEGCPYLAQFAFHGPAIRIYTHGHLPTPRHTSFEAAEIVVIDESFHGSLAHVSSAFDFSWSGVLVALRQKLLIFGSAPGRYVAAYENLKQTMASVGEAVAGGAPLLSGLRDRGIDTEALRSAAELIVSLMQRPRVGPNTAVAKVESELARCRISECRRLAAIFSALAVELGNSRDEAHSIRRLPDGKVEFCTRKSLARRCDGATVLILDADCEELIIRAVFPEVRLVWIDAPLNAEITQIDDLTLSRQRLHLRDGEKVDGALLQVIARMIGRHSRPLVVTYRALIPDLAPLLPQAVFAYFGNLRGTNEWKDFNTVFVVGRQFIPSAAIETIGRALFWDSAMPLVFGRPFRRRYAVGEGVLNSYDEVDPRLQAIRVASRDAETRQALARVRLVHAREQKKVFLLSSQPVGVPVNRLIQLRPGKAVTVFESLGFLPLGGEELARLAPGHFGDKRVAERWRDRADNTPEALKDTFKRGGVFTAVTSYRRRGQRGRASSVLVDPLAHIRPEHSLAKLLTEAGSPPVVVEPWDWEEIDPMPEAPWLPTYRLKSPQGTK